MVKFVLDLGNAFLELANTGLGQVLTKILLISGVGWGASQLLSASKLLPTIISQFKNFADVIAYTAGGAGTLKESLADLAGGGSALAGVFNSALPAILGVTAGIVILTEIGKGIAKLIVTYEEQKEIVSELEAEYDRLYGKDSELDQLINKTGELTDKEKLRLYVLQAQEQSLRNQIALEKAEEYEKFRKKQDKGRQYEIEPNEYEWMTKAEKELYDLEQAYSDLKSKHDSQTISDEEYAKALADLISDKEEYVAELKVYRDLIKSGALEGELTKAEEKYIVIFDRMSESFGEISQGAEEAGDAISNTADDVGNLSNNIVTLRNNLADYRSSISQLSSLQDKINQGYTFSSAEIQKLISQYPDLIDKIYKVEKGWRIEQDAVVSIGVATETLSEIVAQSQEIITKSISTATKTRLKAYGIELKSIESMSDIWSAISDLRKQSGATSSMDLVDKVFGGNMDEYLSFINLGRLQEEINKSLEEIEDLQNKLDDVSTGGGGSSQASEFDKISEKHQNIINLLKTELSLMQEQKADNESIVAKMKEIQNALHELAEWYREQGIEENSEYILELQKQWWEYANQITEIYETIRQETIEAYENLFEVVADRAQEEINALEKQKEAIEAENDALEEQIKLQEALDALSKAKQKKILVYKNGRFQYVEDIDEVSDAQSTIDDIKQEQQLNNRLDAIDKEIEAWEEYKDAWSSVVEDYEKNANRLNAEQQFNIKLEGDNWETRLSNLSKYVAQYNQLMGSLKSDTTTLPSLSGATNKSDVDWSQLWWDAANDTSLSEAERKQIQDWAHAQKVEEMKGTGAKYDEASGTWYYAKGTTSAQGGMSLVGEEGAELRVLNKGDGIIPADVTRNLWSWGMTTPAQMMSNIVNKVGQNKLCSITISNLNLPEVKDGPSFVEYMKNNIWRKAIQLTV